MSRPAPPDPDAVASDVARALAEDVGSGDLAAPLLRDAPPLVAGVVCREDAVLAGAPWFDACVGACAGAEPWRVQWSREDGDEMGAGEKVCRIEAPAAALLAAERAALNFLQTLSSTATVARRFAEAARGTAAVVVDTRKTIPGLRHAQKYAVRVGGAGNHRAGLYDELLLKENHLAAVGGVAAALSGAPARTQVEVRSLAELREALDAGARRILLDNFPVAELKAAVAETAGRAELEASGGYDIGDIREVAQTGVDRISVGALTKHVRAVDFSLVAERRR